MTSYDIFGRCNNALAIITDLLYTVHKSNMLIKSILSCNEDFFHETLSIPITPSGIDIKRDTIDKYSVSEANKIIASMDGNTRKDIFNIVSRITSLHEYNFHTLVHPSCYRSHTTIIGYGCLISPMVSLAPFSKIGNFTYINRNTNIGHHTVIGNFCTISPGCNIAGNCKIQNDCLIGIGATILDQLTIGENSIIGAGSVVTKNIKPNSVYYGVPAKFIRTKK